MYSVSTAFKAGILKPSRAFQCSVTIGTNTYTNADVISINIDGNLQGSGSYTIGNAISQSCTIVFRNNGNVVIDSDVVTVKIGLIIVNTYSGGTYNTVENVQIGKFNINEYSENDSTITIKCFDNMIKLEKPFTISSSITGTTDTVKLLEWVIDQTGIGKEADIPSVAITVPMNKYTCREILSYIASSLGQNVVINRDGKFKFVGLASSGVTITTDNYFKFELDKNQFTIKKLTCKVGNDELTIGTTTNTTMELKIENPLMTDAGMTTAYNSVSQISFMGYSSKFQGNPAFDLGDIITIIDTKGVSRNLPILSQKLKYTGGLVSDISASGENKIANNYMSMGKQYYSNKRFEMDLGNLKNDVNTLSLDNANIKSDINTKTTALQNQIDIAYLQSGENMLENGDFDKYEPTLVDNLGNKGLGTYEVMAFRSWDSIGSLDFWKDNIAQGTDGNGEYFLQSANMNNWYYVPLTQTVNYPFIEDNKTVLLSFLSYYGIGFTNSSTNYSNYLACINANGVETLATPKVIKRPPYTESDETHVWYPYGEYQIVFELVPGTVKLRLNFCLNLNYNIHSPVPKLDKVCLTTASPYKQSQTDTNKAIAEVATNVNTKVDKVEGKGLSTNDYSGAEQTKLSSVATGATKVAGSTTNGNIKINDTETPVYVHPGTGTNPHGTTKEDVSLGNVPNVDTNSQTPTYTESSTLETINTGEYLTIAFGKIKKAINSLISHLGDTISHITSTERNTWNGKLDKTGGTLTGDLKIESDKAIALKDLDGVFRSVLWRNALDKTVVGNGIHGVAINIPNATSAEVYDVATNAYRKIYHEGNKPSPLELGIGNINNTSDMAKPVSTAQQAALNAIQGNIDNIQVGCRNYLYGSNTQVAMISPSSGYSQYDWYNSLPEANASTGVVKYYTVSFVYTPNLNKTMPFTSIVIGNGTDGASWGTRHLCNNNNVKQYNSTKYIYTATFAVDGTTSATIYNYLKFICENNNAGCTIESIKLERGTRATDHVLSQEDMQTKITTPTVYTPTLLNSWINVGGVYSSCGYYKISENIVNLQGLIKSGLVSDPTKLFVLPVGFRPLTNKVLQAQSNNGTLTKSCYVEVCVDGGVYVGPNTSNSWLSLDGLSFPTF